MRICYIANIRLPTEKAHGVQIMKTCEALANAGHEVELIVPLRRNDLSDDPFKYYDVERIFRVKEVRVPNFFNTGKIGFAISTLFFAEMAHFRKSFWAADVVYSRDASVLLQYLLLGRKLVFEAHGAPSLGARLLARFAYRIVVITKAIGESFVRAGTPREKIVVAPDGVDLEAFVNPESREAARARLGLPEDKHVALYIGRLDGWKGVDTLLEASKLLSANILVAIIGGEPEQVAKLSAQYPEVRFLGFRPYRELPDNQAAADVLVLPNTGKSEVSMHYTSPLKLFTYMASGVSIVTSDTPAVHEILTEADAYFFEPDSPEALAEAIGQVFADPSRASEKAQRARAAVQAYSWSERARRIVERV